MITVTRMGHATFGTPDVSRMVDYFTGVLGLDLIARDGGRAFLACPADHHSVVLEPAAAASCGRLSLQVPTETDMDALAKQLGARNIPMERRSDTGPGVADLIAVRDPSGLEIELFRLRQAEGPRPNALGIRPRKLGHTAFYTPDIHATVRFFTEVLGFRVSDWVGDFFVFMRCNADHHVVNFFTGPRQAMHHIAFELNDWNHVKTACDHLWRSKLPLSWGPGRHGPGHNLYTYHVNPDGITVELFTEVDQMSDESSGVFDFRPWHEDQPQRPKVWPPTLETRNFWGLTKPEESGAQTGTGAFVVKR